MEQAPNDNDNRERFIEFANRLALKRPDLKILRNHPRDSCPIPTGGLGHLLQERNAQRKLILPNLSAFGNGALGIFSGYSGEDSGSCDTYSVLACGYNLIGAFSDKMKCIRTKHRLGQKEIQTPHSRLLSSRDREA